MPEPEAVLREEPREVLVLFKAEWSAADIEEFLRVFLAGEEAKGHHLKVVARTDDSSGIVLKVPPNTEESYVRWLSFHSPVQFAQRHHRVYGKRAANRQSAGH